MMMLACTLLLSGCAHAAESTEVLILKIGKADAILITAGKHAVLIDAGEKEDGEEILRKLGEKNIDTLDVMIVTHYDKDHVGGADTVLRGVAVKALYDANYESESKQYEEYLAAIDAAGVPRSRVAEETALTLETLTLTLMPTAIAPEKTGDKEIDNDQSLVVSMADGRHTFLFAGDAEEARIGELLAGGIGAHDVLKMPHHGRDKVNLAALLDAVRPKYVAITDSDKNPADESVLALLSERGVQTYETRGGDIRIVSDEKGITVYQ